MEKLIPAEQSLFNERRQNELGSEHLVLPLSGKFVEGHKLNDNLNELQNGCPQDLVPLTIEVQPLLGKLILKHPQTGEEFVYTQIYRQVNEDLIVRLSNYATGSSFGYDAQGQLSYVEINARSQQIFIYYKDGQITGAKKLEASYSVFSHPNQGYVTHYDKDLKEVRKYQEARFINPKTKQFRVTEILPAKRSGSVSQPRSL